MGTLVWIDDGCIACGSCPVACPAIFSIPADDAEVRGEARVDGRTDPNRIARSLLREEVAAMEAEALDEAAEGCPVEVIRIER